MVGRQKKSALRNASSIPLAGPVAAFAIKPLDGETVFSDPYSVCVCVCMCIHHPAKRAGAHLDSKLENPANLRYTSVSRGAIWESLMTVKYIFTGLILRAKDWKGLWERIVIGKLRLVKLVDVGNKFSNFLFRAITNADVVSSHTFASKKRRFLID